MMTRYHKIIDCWTYNVQSVLEAMPLHASDLFHLTVDLCGFHLIPIMHGEEPTGWDCLDSLDAQAGEFLRISLEQDAYWYGIA